MTVERPPIAVNAAPVRKRLGEVMVESGLLTATQLDQALKLQREKGGRLGEILVGLGGLSREVLLTFLAHRCGVNWVSLEEFDPVSPDAVGRVPAPLAREQKLVPLRFDGKKLTVAMVDPLNVFALDDVKMLTGCEVEVMVASPEEIDRALERLYPRNPKATP